MAEDTMRLIRIRSQRRVTFKRRGFHAKKSLAAVWRRPRGHHNKMRRQLKAKGALPTPGYGSPAGVRGLHPSGYAEVMVYNTDHIAGLDNETQAIRISGSVGGRKRKAILQAALAAGVKVLNARAAPAEQESEEEEDNE